MTTIFEPDHEPPKPESSDTAYGVVQTVLSIVPGAGDLLQLIIAPPLAGRTQHWMGEIAAAVRRLEADKGIRPEELKENPAFIDAFLTATQAALRTSQTEKLTALRNAVFSSALPNAPELAIQQTFIGLIDRFTDWHLRILAIFREPNAWRDGDRPLSHGKSLWSILLQAYPQLHDQRDLCDLIWAELHSARLTTSADIHTTMTGPGTLVKRTTNLGDQFLLFISDPLEK